MIIAEEMIDEEEPSVPDTMWLLCLDQVHKKMRNHKETKIFHFHYHK